MSAELTKEVLTAELKSSFSTENSTPNYFNGHTGEHMEKVEIFQTWVEAGNY